LEIYIISQLYSIVIKYNYIFTATEPTDHSIVDDVMHVIWAKGQEQKNYQHSPKSGLEKDVASVKDFYKQDELKYHGHGSQRGVISINFFGNYHMILFTKLLKNYLIYQKYHQNE